VAVESFWESFRLDPRVPANAAMRASDADREIVRTLLGEAYADGRLSREEYDDRLSALLTSRTLGELPPLVADLALPGPIGLPAPAAGGATDLRARAAAAYRREVQEAASGFLVPSLICLAIWLLTGHGFFWPAFVMLATGANLVRTALRRESIVAGELRRLEQQARRELPPPPPGRPEEMP
jgi:hypothetical protein